MAIDEISKKTWYNVYPDVAEVAVGTEDCYSEATFKKEMDVVFRKSWLYAGRADDLPAVGDYIVRDFPALKATILLSRGADQQIRGFYNVCRHRCAKLMPVDRNGFAKGHVKRFTCEFTDGPMVSMENVWRFLTPMDC